jgi:hypothetical protein
MPNRRAKGRPRGALGRTRVAVDAVLIVWVSIDALPSLKVQCERSRIREQWSFQS